MDIRALTTTLIATLSLCGCSQTKDEQATKPDPQAGGKPPPIEEDKPFLLDIGAAEAGELVESQSPPVVLDVRTPAEFAEGHIAGAINIDFKGESFGEELAKLDRDKTYLMHCRSGNRSGQAKPKFLQLGFQAVYHLDGGMKAWRAAGLPVEK